ncbi:MAG TPA: type II toxin-antitoxin system VapC family toxin [Roseateles sp.]
MKAVDTNVLARFFVNDPDDAEAGRQRPAAIRAMTGRVFVSLTVVLEFEWVLRGFYELGSADVIRVMRALAGMPGVNLESRDEVLVALDACEAHKLDFADALHVVRSGRCIGLITFDKALIKRAAKAGLQITVETASSSLLSAVSHSSLVQPLPSTPESREFFLILSSSFVRSCSTVIRVWPQPA